MEESIAKDMNEVVNLLQERGFRCIESGEESPGVKYFVYHKMPIEVVITVIDEE